MKIQYLFYIVILFFSSFTVSFSQENNDDISNNDLIELRKLIEVEKGKKEYINKNQKIKLRELELIQKRLDTSAKTLMEYEASNKKLTSQIIENEKEEKNILDELNLNSEQTSTLIASLFMLQKNQPPAILMSPNNNLKALRTSFLLSDILPTIIDDANILKARLDKLLEIRNKILADKTTLDKNLMEIRNRQDVISNLYKEKEKELSGLDIARNNTQRKIASLAQKESSIIEALRIIQNLKKMQEIIPVEKRQIIRQNPPTNILDLEKLKGKLSMPVVGEVIANFGDIYLNKTLKGIKIKTNDKAVITSPISGKIAAAREIKPVGNTLVIDVGNDYYLLFVGVGQFFVEEGEIVKNGTLLASVNAGEDGQSVIDIELRRKLAAIDPREWFNF